MENYLKNFRAKWNNRTLEDACTIVSKEYRSFQNSFINVMKKVANHLGGELVAYTKGHYFTSGCIRRGDRYVYFNYETSFNRTHINMDAKDFMNGLLVRTAENEKDYRGGSNNYTSIMDCERVIDRLLNTPHIKW